MGAGVTYPPVWQAGTLCDGEEAFETSPLPTHADLIRELHLKGYRTNGSPVMDVWAKMVEESRMSPADADKAILGFFLRFTDVIDRKTLKVRDP